MNRNIFMFLSVALVLLIPVPGRFAYGIVMLVEFILLMSIGTLSRALLSKIRIEEFQNAMVPIIMVAVSIFFKQLLIMISPLMAFTLGYAVYLPAVSAFLLGTLAEKKSASLVSDVKKNCMTTLSISLPIAVVFFIRDLLGYGTITLPAHNGIFEIHIIPKIEGFKFATVLLASIPGAFISLAACTFIINKFGLRWDKRKDKSLGADEKNVSEENAKPENLVENQEPVNPPQEPATKIEAAVEDVHEEKSAPKVSDENPPTENPPKESPSVSSEPPVQYNEEQSSAEEKKDEARPEKPVLENPFEKENIGPFAPSKNFPDAPSLLNLQKLLEETDVD